jgi:hypothetical protein
LSRRHSIQWHITFRQLTTAEEQDNVAAGLQYSGNQANLWWKDTVALGHSALVVRCTRYFGPVPSRRLAKLVAEELDGPAMLDLPVVQGVHHSLVLEYPRLHMVRVSQSAGMVWASRFAGMVLVVGSRLVGKELVVGTRLIRKEWVSLVAGMEQLAGLDKELALVVLPRRCFAVVLALIERMYLPQLC